MKFLGFLVLSLSLAMTAVAQHGDHASQPTVPIALEKGLGAVHYPVTTKSAEAQRFFDQGMRYTYAFHHEQAIASFRRAAELDPDMAMAHWGVALALGPNINLPIDAERMLAAHQAAGEASTRASNASEKERDLIAALQRRYTNQANVEFASLDRDYAKAMAEVARKYPDDVDIATLHAEALMDLRPWKYWNADGTPAEGTEEIVRVLEGVLAKAPGHTGANHYYIHAVEASREPGRALKSAERLQKLAPMAGHLVHMPAHIFQRTGNYAGAAIANEVGAEADRAFVKKYGGGGIYPLMYYNHNLWFGAASHAMQGKYADAKRLGDEVATNAGVIAKEMSMVEPATALPVLLALRFNRSTDVLRMPDPAAGRVSTAMWHFARGVAFARLGNVSGAESEQKAFEAARAKLTDDVGMMQNSEKSLGSVASHVLTARIAEARGEWPAAFAAYRQAIELEDELNYNEPQDWFYPVRESLGAALLRSGDAAAAEAVFRADLARNPKNPRSLFGLAEALKKQKKDATSVRAEFRRGWKGGALRVEDL